MDGPRDIQNSIKGETTQVFIKYLVKTNCGIFLQWGLCSCNRNYTVCEREGVAFASFTLNKSRNTEEDIHV